MSPDRRTLLALFSIAFGLRILYAALVGTDPAMNPSPGTYDYYLAERMQTNVHWLAEPFTPHAPGYPMLLAVTFRAFGVRQWVAILLQAFLGAATALMLFRVGEKRLARGVGLIAALWLALTVQQMHFASIFVRSVLSTFALTWFAYALVRPFRRMRQAVWAGFVYTFLIHVDAQYLILFPVAVLFFVLFATRHRLLNLQYMLLFVATVFMLSLPWTLRNYAVYGDVVPVGLEAHRYLRPVGALITPGERRASVGIATRAHAGGFAANTAEYWRVVRLQETEGDPERGIRAAPAWSTRHNVVNTLNFGLLLPFAALGVILALVRRNRAALVLTVIVAVHYLTHAFLGADENTRLAVEPLIILVAFYGVFEAVRSLRGSRDADAAPRAAAA